MKKVIIVAGPTAAGKTDCALQIASREGAELICMDAFQVYRELPILTAMPGPRELMRCPHHLFAAFPVREGFSAGLWLHRVADKIQEVWQRGSTPLLVGGTMLYLRIFQRGLEGELTPVDFKLRTRLEAQLHREGSHALHARLHQLWPQRASELHPNDAKRIVRALERCEFSTHRSRWHPLEAFSYRLDKRLCCPPRDVLYDRIERRVDDMIQNGAVEEVREAMQRFGLEPGCNAWSCLGVREIAAYCNQEMNLNATVQLLKRNTRRFAKRQLTWCRTEGPFELWENTHSGWQPSASSASSRLSPMPSSRRRPNAF